MRALIVGASSGLGRALFDGLQRDGHEVFGVARSVPRGGDLTHWIAADFRDPALAADTVSAAAPAELDAVIYNLGVWEPTAFTPEYEFTSQEDTMTVDLIATNVTGPLLLLQRLMPRLLASKRPRVILTGSTSALPGNGRPEVAFGASKTALNGIAEALREGYRAQQLAVTTLQLGSLNTEDSLDVDRDIAAAREGGSLIPVHDVVAVVRTVLGLSSASFVREVVLPALRDERF
ncbi:short-subunit dehydrogenase [Leucobacter luti]|uniref:Short-subunit dehydrogenase n=1 Tax=Leucobacter luti TaxID=340320 RepID=A0A4R6S7L5_9MICO|nr:SDR family oxidoreductase [Leucobacter luti]TDP95711.1 short-subunit dehydrogenase [Leucobacter luti]